MEIVTENLTSTSGDWKSIDGYCNYEISCWGSVRNTRTGRILKSGTCSGGYLVVSLSKGGQLKMYTIHKLVARAWVPNPEGKNCVDHRDGDRTNNHHENLRAATQSENCRNTKNISMERVATKEFRFTNKQTSGMQELWYRGKQNL